MRDWVSEGQTSSYLIIMLELSKKKYEKKLLTNLNVFYQRWMAILPYCVWFGQFWENSNIGLKALSAHSIKILWNWGGETAKELQRIRHVYMIFNIYHIYIYIYVCVCV